VPQGESVLDASMMAELIVTKKEVWPQLKKSTRNLKGQAEKPRRGWSTIAVGGNTSGGAFNCLVPWFGRFRRRGSLPPFGRRLKGSSGRTRRVGHTPLKAIRKIGGSGIAGGVVARWAQYGLRGCPAIFSALRQQPTAGILSLRSNRMPPAMPEALLCHAQE